MRDADTTSNPVNAKPEKSRRFTVLLTLLFVAIFAIGVIAAIAPIAGNIDSMDVSGAVAFHQHIKSHSNTLLVWRGIVYTILLASFYFYNRYKIAEMGGKKAAALVVTVRLFAYLAIFEIFIVQNALNKAFSLAIGG